MEQVIHYKDVPDTQVDWDAVHRIEAEEGVQYNPATIYSWWTKYHPEVFSSAGTTHKDIDYIEYFKTCTICGYRQKYEQ